jgi:hypothetical protein
MKTKFYLIVVSLLISVVALAASPLQAINGTWLYERIGLHMTFDTLEKTHSSYIIDDTGKQGDETTGPMRNLYVDNNGRVQFDYFHEHRTVEIIDANHIKVGSIEMYRK